MHCEYLLELHHWNNSYELQYHIVCVCVCVHACVCACVCGCGGQYILVAKKKKHFGCKKKKKFFFFFFFDNQKQKKTHLELWKCMNILISLCICTVCLWPVTAFHPGFLGYCGICITNDIDPYWTVQIGRLIWLICSHVLQDLVA